MKPSLRFAHALPIPEGVAHSTKRLVRSFRDNVQLGTLLAFVAGCVNSVAFVHFGTYVSHVSGHATRAAINYAEGDLTSAFLFFMEFMAFIFGAATTAFILRGQTAASTRVKYTLPTFLELTLILIFMVSSGLDRSHTFQSPYFSHLTFLLAIAMGIQNAMLRQASGTLVRTTHMTGVATDFGVEIGAAMRAAVDAFWTSKWSVFHAISAAGRAFIERLGVSRFLFHGFILVSFTSGAVVGTLGFLLYNDYALVIPAFTLLLIGLREYFRVLPVDENPSSQTAQP